MSPSGRSDDPLRELTHLVLYDYPLPQEGGISPMATWIAYYLKERGYRTVLIGNRKFLESDLYRRLELDVQPLDKIIRKGAWSDLRLMRLYLQLQRRFGARVMFYPMMINYVKIAAVLPQLKRWQMASFLYGNETLRLLDKRPGTLRRNLRRCTQVFAVSRYTAELVRERFGLSNVSVFWPGIRYKDFQGYDPDYRSRRGWSDREVVLMLSRLAGRKGHHTALQAIDRLHARRPRVLLAIAGSGHMRDELEARTRELGLEGNVEFLGRVDESDKASLYRAADVYCMPSEVNIEKADVEGFGITFLEAAACGTLAVGSHTGGIPDALDDGRAGLLVPPGDPVALEETLESVLSEPRRYDAMRERARQRAESEFDWPKRVDAMVDVLRDAVTSR
ncbi:MAG: glycosyltransferase family 4 protein [Gemmatimonadales bacterium]|jgi:phosphatidylinositol alpha-1,6-mannosyltransferase